LQRTTGARQKPPTGWNQTPGSDDHGVVEHARWFEMVSAAADDQLDAQERTALDEHLAACASCRTQLEQFERQRRSMRLSPPADHGALVAAVAAKRTDAVDRLRSARRLLVARTAIAFGVMAIVVGGLLAITVGQAPEPGSPTLLADQVVIDTGNGAFETTQVRVKAGTEVEWHNAGGTTHQLVRKLGGATVAEELAPGQTESATFAEPGTYTFYCEIHEGMSGTVTVDA
jgi:plastocyanin